MVEKKIEENPKAGIVLNKSTPSEIKMRFSELLEHLNSIEYQIVTRDSIHRYGICKECIYFKPGESKEHGVCMFEPDKRNPVTNYGLCMGIYDTCWRNTPKSMNCTKCKFLEHNSDKKYCCTQTGEIITWDKARQKTCSIWRYFA